MKQKAKEKKLARRIKDYEEMIRRNASNATAFKKPGSVNK